MIRIFLIAFMLAFAVTPAFAEEAESSFEFNNDRFMIGSTVVQDSVGVDDLFMAGETVESKQDITGSAHIAGRQVISTGAIGGDAYASAMEVTIDGTVSGDLTVAGYTVQIGEVGGDLRASSKTLTLSGPISGYALISGDNVEFNAVAKGDVSLAAGKVKFSETSRIEGKLTIYEDKLGATEIPSQVIAEDRVERRDISEWSDETSETEGIGSKFLSFFKSVLFLTVLAVSIASIRPHKLADLRQSVLDHPLRNFLYGLLGLASGLGAAILLLLTGIGFSLALVVVLLVLMGLIAGYVLGTYAVGVKLLNFAKRPEPDTLRSRALAALIGALTISIVALIPYIGWILILAVIMVGTGSLAVRLFRPKLLAAT